MPTEGDFCSCDHDLLQVYVDSHLVHDHSPDEHYVIGLVGEKYFDEVVA